jgi:predicted double-glycine peptidase
MQRIITLTCCIAAIGGLVLLAWPRAAAGEDRAPLRDPEHIFQQHVLSWQELRQQHVVMQKHDYSCGAATLSTVLRYYWGDCVTEEAVLKMLMKSMTPEEKKDRIKNGLAISDLRRAAVKMNYLSTVGTLTFQKLTESKIPLIVPIKIEGHDHFVVYRGTINGRVYLADPIRGNVRPTISEFCCQWQKHAALVVVKRGEKPRDNSALCIRQNEVLLGQTNDQLIRTEAARELFLPRR